MFKLIIIFLLLTVNLYSKNNYKGAVIKPKYNLDETYLRVATGVMSRNLKNSGINLNIKVISYDKGLEKIRNAKLDMIAIMPSTYFENEKLINAKAKTLLTYPINGEKLHEFYLLANKNEKNVLKNLKKYEVIVPEIHESAKKFYKLLMYKKYKNKALQYISKNLKSENKESKILYDVFFDRNKLAIVPKFTFDLVKELNPQIGRNLKIVKKTNYKTLAFVLLTTKSLNDKREKNLLKLLKEENNILIENSRSVPSNIINPIVLINKDEINETRKIYLELKDLERNYK